MAKSIDSACYVALGLRIRGPKGMDYPEIQGPTHLDLDIVHREIECPYPKAFHRNLQMLWDQPLFIDQCDQGFLLNYDHWRVGLYPHLNAIYYTDIDSEHKHRLQEMLEHVAIPIYALLSDVHSIALHASAIVFRQKAWLFLGPSGAGKSTFAWKLSERYSEIDWLSDDWTLLKIKEQGNFEVFRGALGLRLWEKVETIPKISVIGTLHGKVKYWHRLSPQTSPKSHYPLGALVFIQPWSKLRHQCTALKGVDKGRVLLSQTWDFEPADRVWKLRRFKQMGILSRHYPLWSYCFPKGDHNISQNLLFFRAYLDQMSQ